MQDETIVSFVDIRGDAVILSTIEMNEETIISFENAFSL
jgi:hypothetical protein